VALHRYTVKILNRDFGDMRLEDVTPEAIERWKPTLSVSNRTVHKYLVVMHGIFKRAMKVWGLPRNPMTAVDRPRIRVSDDLHAFSPEEIHALVRAATSEQDGAVFLTAAFTGLRMGELLALQWGDVDFGGQSIRVRRSYNAHGGLSSPKSGKVRSVPMVPDVASALAALGTRELLTGDEDLVFLGDFGEYMDGSALRDRYKRALARAGLRELRFHDLRHTFGTLAVRRAEVPAVQAWMGHSAIQTTMRYVHYRDRGREAELLAEAFRAEADVPEASGAER
jgi:integrase